MDKKRIFAAIDISDDARERVANYIAALRAKFKDVPVRWEKPEKLHITIKFAGSIDEAALKSLTAMVDAVAAGTSPFSLTLTGTGAFVKRNSRANVLWIGSRSASSRMDELAARIDVQAVRRRLKPHVTIARIKDAQIARRLIEEHLDSIFEPVTFTVEAISIYESNLLPSGSVYTVLSRHPFAEHR